MGKGSTDTSQLPPKGEDYGIPDVRDFSELSLVQSLEYVEWLMRWYCREPSRLIADIIIDRLEVLRQRKEPENSADFEWSCSRLLKLWDYIVEENHGAARA